MGLQGAQAEGRGAPGGLGSEAGGDSPWTGAGPQLWEGHGRGRSFQETLGLTASSAPQFPVCESRCKDPDGAGPRLPLWPPFLGVTLAKSLHLCLSFLGNNQDNQRADLRGLLWGLIQRIPTARSQPLQSVSSPARTMTTISHAVMCRGANRVRCQVLAVRPWSSHFICLGLFFLL